MTSRAARTPDFLIIGAQKCGTTWLHQQLRQHPEIFLTAEKDVEFFSYQAALHSDQFARWTERFAAAGSDQLVGDSNAAYFWTRTTSDWNRQPDGFSTNLPQAVHEWLGHQLQLIISLRDPVERTISAYIHHLRHRAITLEQSIFATDLPLGIIDIGFYAQHLQSWLEYFPATQIHLLSGLFESEQSKTELLAGVCRFLGVNPGYEFAAPEQVVYQGISRQWDVDGVWLALDDLPDQQLPQRPVPLRRIQGRHHCRILHPLEVARLKDIFAQDQARLQSLLHRQKARS